VAWRRELSGRSRADQEADGPVWTSRWALRDGKTGLAAQAKGHPTEQRHTQGERHCAAYGDQLRSAALDAADEDRQIHPDTRDPDHSVGPAHGLVAQRGAAVHGCASFARAWARCSAKMNWTMRVASRSETPSNSQPASQ